MVDKFTFEIVTPEQKVYSDQVDEVVLPTPQGEVGILPHHIPLVSLLQPGEIRIKKDGVVSFLAVSGGFIQVHPAKVIALADTAERAEDIDETRAEEARKRAAALLDEKRDDAVEFAALSAKIEKELARVRVAKRRSRRPQPTIQRSN